MNSLIDIAFNRNRVTTLILLMILAFGSYAYWQIPRESARCTYPDNLCFGCLSGCFAGRRRTPYPAAARD
ncbi:hypothetical protein ACFQEX_24270 [Roseibium salinum]|uniref:hypothetical protein n=1 Tax=Roseibium salinum TaxID=1604349 RepID=UPI00361D5C12